MSEKVCNFTVEDFLNCFTENEQLSEMFVNGISCVTCQNKIGFHRRNVEYENSAAAQRLVTMLLMSDAIFADN